MISIGYYTRFGDVRELLEQVDDRYVIMNSGDEMSFRFAEQPPPPAGWVRDFVIVGDGWIKDGDYNSTFSKTVLPLPYHAKREYTEPPGRLEDEWAYRQHPEDWQTYHTRYVTPTFSRTHCGIEAEQMTGQPDRAGSARPLLHCAVGHAARDQADVGAARVRGSTAEAKATALDASRVSSAKRSPMLPASTSSIKRRRSILNLRPIMPEVASMGAAVSIVDFDRDGWPDIYVTNSGEGSRNALYRNLGDGTFKDVAGELGIADVNQAGTGVSMGAVWGDYDNDGYEDLLLIKWGRPELFHNDHGRGFTRVTEHAGLPRWINANTALWFDYDGDGLLDMFIGGYYSEDIDLWHLTTHADHAGELRVREKRRPQVSVPQSRQRQVRRSQRESGHRQPALGLGCGGG